MSEDIRELIAEEMGMNPCVVTGSYASCDGDCDNCPACIQFVKEIKEGSNEHS